MAYSEAGFPQTGVSGHEGVLSRGCIGSRKVLVFSGRFHQYEGYGPETILLPVRLSKLLGARLLIVTNAAGGINASYRTGDLMLIDKLIQVNENRSGYDNAAAIDRARDIARQNRIFVRSGSYIFTSGPSYETRAEIRAFRTLGADAVGMSTSAELLEAHRLGLSNLGISLISNMAAGIKPGKLSHDEISKAARLRESDFTRLVTELLTNLI